MSGEGASDHREIQFATLNLSDGSRGSVVPTGIIEDAWSASDAHEPGIILLTGKSADGVRRGSSAENLPVNLAMVDMREGSTTMGTSLPLTSEVSVLADSRADGVTLVGATSDGSKELVVASTVRGVIREIPLDFSGGTMSGSVTPDGTKAVVAGGPDADIVALVDLKSGAVGPRWASANPRISAISPDGRYAYVTHYAFEQGEPASDISVLDLQSGTVATTIPVDDAGSIQITKDNHAAYVYSPSEKAILVLGRSDEQ